MKIKVTDKSKQQRVYISIVTRNGSVVSVLRTPGKKYAYGGGIQ